jgi:hypothetical protein
LSHRYPVALLTEIRAAQEELGNRVDRRGVNGALTLPAVLTIARRRQLCEGAR